MEGGIERQRYSRRKHGGRGSISVGKEVERKGGKKKGRNKREG